MKKDTGLRIRIEREIRERFLDYADRPAAKVLREFIRKYVNKYEILNNEKEDT